MHTICLLASLLIVFLISAALYSLNFTLFFFTVAIFFTDDLFGIGFNNLLTSFCAQSGVDIVISKKIPAGAAPSAFTSHLQLIKDRNISVIVCLSTESNAAAMLEAAAALNMDDNQLYTTFWLLPRANNLIGTRSTAASKARVQRMLFAQYVLGVLYSCASNPPQFLTTLTGSADITSGSQVTFAYDAGTIYRLYLLILRPSTFLFTIFFFNNFFFAFHDLFGSSV